MNLRRTVTGAAVVTLMCGLFAQPAWAGGKTKVYEYSVVGTHIEFDEFGLPARLEGDVYYRGGGKDGKWAGTYTEELTPIFFNGMFIGTSGVSVFSFGKNGKSTLTTLNVSYIVGMVNGAFQVQSTGQVVTEDGTGKFTKVDGEFMSSSTVILGPDFSMNVDLTLSLSHGSK